MRIALVHSYFSSRVPSGENRAVDAQAAALRGAGHDVVIVGQYTDRRLARSTYPIEAALTAASGRGPSPVAELTAFEPDVVHVHGLFPNFGRTWLSKWRGPLVATMHNYRPMCPAATLFRDGHLCHDCPDAGSAWSAVRHGCFHNSPVATLPVALGTRFARDPLLERADVVITLSDEMRGVFADLGADPMKLRVLSNCLDAPADPGAGGDYWVFAGRFEPEKGLGELTRVWPAGRRLVVAGAGRAEESVVRNPDIDYVGYLSSAAVRALLGNARGLVFPSRWLEGLALVCLEALSVGTPILAFDDVPAGRVINDLGVGLAAPRDRFLEALDEADRTFPLLRESCVEVFSARFTPAAWIPQAESVYAHAQQIGGAPR